MRELVVVTEPGAEEARGGSGSGDDEIACFGDELGLQVGVVSPGGDARRAEQQVAETRRRQQNDIARHQPLSRLPGHLEPYRSRGYGVERRAVREREIESPRLVRVNVGEDAARDAGDIEHVGERVHAARLAVRLRATRHTDWIDRKVAASDMSRSL